jgi:hypothetical protein
MSTTVISIARQFSPTPAGRCLADGPFPGEKFRTDLLLPALRQGDGAITVNMDGASGYGFSFLEEAFGGLVHVEGFDPALLHRRLTIQSVHPSWVKRVWQCIDNAQCGRGRITARSTPPPAPPAHRPAA